MGSTSQGKVVGNVLQIREKLEKLIIGGREIQNCQNQRKSVNLLCGQERLREFAV